MLGYTHSIAFFHNEAASFITTRRHNISPQPEDEKGDELHDFNSNMIHLGFPHALALWPYALVA